MTIGNICRQNTEWKKLFVQITQKIVNIGLCCNVVGILCGVFFLQIVEWHVVWFHISSNCVSNECTHMQYFTIINCMQTLNIPNHKIATKSNSVQIKCNWFKTFETKFSTFFFSFLLHISFYVSTIHYTHSLIMCVTPHTKYSRITYLYIYQSCCRIKYIENNEPTHKTEQKKWMHFGIVERNTKR